MRTHRLGRALIAGTLAAGMTLSAPLAGHADEPNAVGDGSGAYAAEELVIVYDDAGEGAGSMRALASTSLRLESAGVTVEEVVADATDDRGTVAVARIQDGRSVEEAVQAAESVSVVAFAQPNYRYELLDMPDDPAANVVDPDTFENQYYLYGSDDFEGVKGANVIDAWIDAACVLARMAGVNGETPYEQLYSDVTDGWFWSSDITWAHQTGIMTGYAPTPASSRGCSARTTCSRASRLPPCSTASPSWRPPTPSPATRMPSCPPTPTAARCPHRLASPLRGRSRTASWAMTTS